MGQNQYWLQEWDQLLYNPQKMRDSTYRAICKVEAQKRSEEMMFGAPVPERILNVEVASHWDPKNEYPFIWA